MLKLISSFFAVLLFLLNVANGYESKYSGHNYDSFTLAQSWPQTNCWDLNKKWHNSDDSCSPCKVPRNSNSWTLHGLWPSNIGGQSPWFCSSSVKYKPNSLSSELRAEMSKKWSTYNLKMTNDAFWNYEYKKHGSCALDVTSTNSVSKYFSTALNLLDRYNVGKILEAADIVPGRNYEFYNVYRTIQNALGANVFITCSHNPDNKEQYLNQIYVCFDKSFRLVDCNNDSNISNCKRKHKVVYPKNLRAC